MRKFTNSIPYKKKRTNKYEMKQEKVLLSIPSLVSVQYKLGKQVKDNKAKK